MPTRSFSERAIQTSAGRRLRVATPRAGPGFYWEDFARQPYSCLLILNGKHPLAEEVTRASVSRVNADLAKPGVWKAMAEFSASLGDVYGYWPLVEVLCRLGRFHEAETLVAEQLGPGRPALDTGADQDFQDPAMGRPSLFRPIAGSRARSGRAGHPLEGRSVRRGGYGMAAAFASGDTNAYARLGRWGRVRYTGNAEAKSAEALFWALILRPQEEDLSLTLPDLLHRIEEGKDYHWTAVHPLFMKGQLAYRKGEYEEALRSWMSGSNPRTNGPKTPASCLTFGRSPFRISGGP